MTSRPTSRRMFLRMSATGLSILAIRPDRVAADEDAAALLESSARAMAQIKSFHFEMETIDGRATILDNLELTRVIGDVLRPDSFQATLTAKLAIIEVSVDVVSVGGSAWVTDPTKPGKQWRQVASSGETGGADFTDLINPDRLFLAAVSMIDDPVIDGTEKIGDQECTVVTGSFDPTRLQELASPVAGQRATPPSLLTEDPVFLTVWIAGDGKIWRIEEEGPLTQSESNDVIRAITFSDFDAPIEIVAPE